MTNVLVDDSYLSDIADTIRAKLGVTDTYLPSEMADAIDDIGGGVTPTGTVNITTNGTHDVTQYASAEVAVPNSYSASDEGKVVNNGGLVAQTSDTVTENGTVDTTLINSLTVNVSGGGGTDKLAELCNGTMTRLDDDNITSFLVSLRGTTFNLGSIFLKNLETLSVSYCFGNNKVQTVVLPSLKNVTSAAYFFSGASSLTKVDLGASFSIETYGVRNNAFTGASAMNVLILRKTSEIVPLQNISAFNNTPFASGNAGGTLYVPQALITSYQAANNWNTILGYANNSIQKIEGSIYETAYADGTPIA